MIIEEDSPRRYHIEGRLIDRCVAESRGCRFVWGRLLALEERLYHWRVAVVVDGRRWLRGCHRGSMKGVVNLKEVLVTFK